MLTTATHNNKNKVVIGPEKTEALDSRTQNNLEILKQFKQGDFSSAKKYSGFGGLRQALKQEKTQALLAEFLSPKEIEGLVKSTRTGYFTPPLLIDFIYDLVEKLGFKYGKILEPACGHGAFFERMPKAMRENSDVTGVELEKISADIAASLYPDVKILNQGFHHFHEGGFDLIIGNPPYAPFTVFDQEHPDLRKEMIHHYFVAKSARLLKEGGLLVMVLPCYVLDIAKGHFRHEIAEVADLVAAYRFPENLFSDARITVDVVIFQRVKEPKKDWTDSVLIERDNNERFYLSRYFVKHPEHVIGELETYEVPSHFDDRPRRGLKCVAPLKDVEKRLPELVNTLQPLAPL